MSKSSVVASDTLSVALNSLLSEEISLSEQLLKLIEQEKEHMALPLDEASESILQTKLSLLQHLQSVTSQRQNLMLQHGYESTPQGIEFCSLACAHAPAIRQHFSHLSYLARECHSANQMLGQLLHRKSGFFSRLLANLSESDQPQLYQANGQHDNSAVLHKRLTV